MLVSGQSDWLTQCVAAQPAPTGPKVSHSTDLLDEAYVTELIADLGSERFIESIATCCASLRETAQEIHQAAKQKDFRQVGEAVHRLKGLSGIYGLTGLWAHATELREAANRAPGDPSQYDVFLSLEDRLSELIETSAEKLELFVDEQTQHAPMP